jgi:hypothetical protein
MEMLTPFVLTELLVSVLFLSTMIAVPLGCIITLAINRLFRHRVERSKRETAGALPNDAQPIPRMLQRNVSCDLISPTRTVASTARGLKPLADARRRDRQLAWIYGVATSLYPLILSIVFYVEFYPGLKSLTFGRALVAAFYFLVNVTPVAVALVLVLRRQVRILIVAVLFQLLAVWLYPGHPGLSLWLWVALFPTGVMILFNSRHLRAVGPIVVVAILLLIGGGGTGTAYAAFYLLDVMGPASIVDHDPQLPFFDALLRWYDDVLALPPAQMRAAIDAFTSHPLSVVQIANPGRLTTEAMVLGLCISVAGLGFGITAAWAFLHWLAHAYQTRQASDQMLAIDVTMMTFTIYILFAMWGGGQWIASFSVLAASVGYFILGRVLLARRNRRMKAVSVRTLLLLRVFGFDRRTQRLLDDVGQRWRHLGPIRLIAAADVASALLEPREFFEFLNGKLTRAFVKGQDDLNKRMADDAQVPDPDGRFRVDDFFCHNSAWQMTVSRLIHQADAVLMDLRCFTKRNKGVIYEINQLIAMVPMGRVVILVDHSTDHDLLERTINDAWTNMPDDSPNALLGSPRPRILMSSSSHNRTVDTLLVLLCTGFAEH